ncbi:hypothetical protein A3Q56_07695 [Intoshia linei]|uniref:Tyr recombinase domain-containing protein n=1 Tax=Intoshia linei TaxID=1819745 RepID=A0A177ARD3_9BILA|nr:hypothetical protein A3Q56_07695 [Intoshia linei]
MSNLLNKPGNILDDSGNLAVNPNDWFDEFEEYWTLLCITNNKWDSASKKILMKHLLGQKAKERLKINGIDLNCVSIDCIKKNVLSWKSTNISLNRLNFLNAMRKCDESMSVFIDRLVFLAKGCNYKSYTRDMIRDKSIHGCNNEKLQNFLVQKQNLNLYEVVQVAKTYMNKPQKIIKILRPVHQKRITVATTPVIRNLESDKLCEKKPDPYLSNLISSNGIIINSTNQKKFKFHMKTNNKSSISFARDVKSAVSDIPHSNTLTCSQKPKLVDMENTDETYSEDTDELTSDSNIEINTPKDMSNFKSIKVYEKWHRKFLIFISENKLPETLDSIIKYFIEISKIYSTSTLWQAYSCLNKHYGMNKSWASFNDCIILKNIIRNSPNESFVKKQSRILTKDQIIQFISISSEHPKFLVRKAIAIIGYYGGLSCTDLTHLTFSDVIVKSKNIKIFIRKRNFDSSDNVNFYFLIPKSEMYAQYCPFDILKQYINASSRKTTRFFQNYNIKTNDFVGQPMGKNTVSSIPKFIATSLNLENPEMYTGYCFKRSAACGYFDEDGMTVSLKRKYHNDIYKSTKRTKNYVADTIEQDLKVYNSLNVKMVDENQ